MTLQLRAYQREGIDALYRYWSEDGGNALLVYPTGAGKSLVAATLARELLEGWPELRIGIVTHVRELISQNLQELLSIWAAAPAGVYSAGLGRRDTQARILFMGIQSVHNKAARLGPFDVLLVDEVHLIPRSSDTMYGRFISACRDLVPDMRIVGLTATPYRLDSGRLDRGREALFDDVVYEANVSDLIAQGYLSALISKATLAEIDTKGVAVRGGEFVAGELEAVASAPEIVEAAVREIVGFGAERRGWLAFCSGVDHAIQVRDEIRRHGISCETVTGDTEPALRDSIIAQFKRGELRSLTSVAVLTTGFNAPHVDLIAMLRPTLSTGLYVQMVGRGFRKAPGKEDCLVLDFAGNVRRHGPVDAVQPKRDSNSGRRQEDEEQVRVKPDTVRAKECPSCRALVGLHELVCTNPHCKHEWPKPEPKHQAEAEEVFVLSTDPAIKPTWLEVSGVGFFRHEKPGSPPSVRAEYRCGLIVHRQWLCFEHLGYAREKASLWWRKAGGEHPVPQTVEEALQRIREGRELGAIGRIRVRPSGKFFEVVDHAVRHDSEAAA